MSTALILVDIQKDYFPGGRMELFRSQEAAEAAARLLAAFRQEGLPVIHVRHVSLHEGATFFIPGTDGIDFHPLMAPRFGEPVVEKHYPNSFRGTTLGEILVSGGIDKVVVAGMMSHMCIDATVRAAFDAGYACLVAHDACATRGLTFGGVDVSAEQVHASFMAALSSVYAEVTGSNEVIRLFTRSAFQA